jgi:diguanylate cyclase (GGDEF)-like protein/putative nucleotidyltransferase with HDIG domain
MSGARQVGGFRSDYNDLHSRKLAAAPTVSHNRSECQKRGERPVWWSAIYIGMVLTFGAFAILSSLPSVSQLRSARFITFVAVGLLTSLLKVRLPGMTGNMSMHFVFVLLGLLELDRGELVLIASLSMAAQSLWSLGCRPRAVQVSFNVAAVAVSAAGAHLAFAGHHDVIGSGFAIRYIAAALIYFFLNQGAVAVVICLTEAKPIGHVWREWLFFNAPYYLIGALVVYLLYQLGIVFDLIPVTFVLPCAIFLYRSYGGYVARLERERDLADEQRRRAEDLAALHLRTIEVLAAVIEGKDESSDHLNRVRVYSIEIGKEMNLSKEDLQAVDAAAILHDIGNLAVPEHITAKPGKLTPEEFERLRVHPIVGAEIIERVRFPCSVAPIVRSHHERWDGSGYPDGLRGEAIPLGARILAAVDSLDAMLSSRPYRPALTLADAIREIEALAGTNFDPQVVEVLSRRCAVLEKMMANAAPPGHGDMEVLNSTDVGPGFRLNKRATFLDVIVSTRQEEQVLLDLTRDLGNSLCIGETVAIVGARLKELVSYDCIVLYQIHSDVLRPLYVDGQDARLFAGLEIPLGEGLAGVVAERRAPIINGNPVVEIQGSSHTQSGTTLNSSIAVALEASEGTIGVLALYRADSRPFTKDHYRLLTAISPKITAALENALRYKKAEEGSLVDDLTGLFNSRALFLRLPIEIERARRHNRELAVALCDLDGFKCVNDTLGHLAGNQLLQAVAKGLRTVCREYDYIARLGGDEFVLLLPEMREEEAIVFAGRLNEVVQAATSEVCASATVGMSIGFSFLGSPCSDANSLLAEADRQMYRAKELRKSRRGNQGQLGMLLDATKDSVVPADCGPSASLRSS